MLEPAPLLLRPLRLNFGSLWSECWALLLQLGQELSPPLPVCAAELVPALCDAHASASLGQQGQPWQAVLPGASRVRWVGLSPPGSLARPPLPCCSHVQGLNTQWLQMLLPQMAAASGLALEGRRRKI